jgi:UDPglucose--hexose-1-phosphate uridylyltransferase
MRIEYPHRRLNPLTREWVLISPQRDKRPWQGQVEKAPTEDLLPYDPGCYLCPGNSRAGGHQNPRYTSTLVFDNDFPALLPETDAFLIGAEEGWGTIDSKPLYVADPVYGFCRVVCFSPRHDLSLPELSQVDVEAVVKTWIDQTRGLAGRDEVAYVQVFENKGAMMGCSNPHPHSQIWATSLIPNEPVKELAGLRDYRNRYGSCLLCDYLVAERANAERIVSTNEHFTALIPFWAVWPFEILIIAHRHLGALTDLDSQEISGLADLLRKVTARYDNLFEISFPYSMGFHQSPVDGEVYPEWHLHAHYYPPLLRSAAVRKFMVGFEMLAMPQRDLTPERAAERLRALSEVHYRCGRD